MFVGHATFAFGVVALAAVRLGASRERALALGVAAGLFAAVPDVDMAYALVGLLTVDPTSPMAVAQSFWGASTVVHRAVTHSLVVGVPAAAAFALAPTHRRLAAAALAALVGVGVAVSGPLPAVIVGLFAAGGWFVAHAAHAYDVRGATLFGVALVGLLTHPFGDLFTGQPPELFYPLDVAVLDGRVALSADPTLHLLGAFGVELFAIWLGVAAALWLTGRRFADHVNPRAASGAAYALAVLVLPPPTVDASYQFVFSVVAVGFVGVVPAPRFGQRSLALPSLPTGLVTGLAAVTLAGVAYAVAYATGLA
ncbi:metal-dependent hydrolase [Halobacterium sp. CBA1126]|uniref:metal-dependent hydrolase n=1 Tax=Halobacterium sp. CBA1126 TaxID=2668074 RepID=UPI0012F9FC5E|nr:metal-dependent hydrolase [Halobacterium sp. CBA1126]MUV59711.1 metal-dependent hydrolase [Halobacterium sp. CBA1126]